MKFKKCLSIALICVMMLSFVACSTTEKKQDDLTVNGIVVFQSDFGLNDGAVSAMKGVAAGVDSDLKLYDLTHGIPSYSIWDGAFRLNQTIEYWPEGTVFVSVVDPGVGSERNSVVVKLGNGQFIVTPDNGTVTLVAERYGVDEVRIIDEAVNRRNGEGNPYTFHGRDVYAYTGARLASGTITFEEVGPILDEDLMMLDYQKPSIENGKLMGNIPALDVQYGNVWTNIDHDLADQMNLELGKLYLVEIFNGDTKVYSEYVPYVHVYSDVPEGTPLMYFNSLNCLSIAINMGNFAADNGVSYGNNWTFVVTEK